MMPRLLLFALVSSTLAFAGEQTMARQAPPEVESALRSRVEAFYTHFQKGQFREAEAYIDEQSQDAFSGAKKNRIISYEIKTIKWAEDFRSANVLVACSTIVPMLGSAPLAVPLASDWQYNGEDWFMHLTETQTTEMSDAGENPQVRTPFGQMTFSQNVQGGFTPPAAAPPRPDIEDLANMYKVSETSLSFPRSADMPVTRTVKLKNQSIGKLSIERLGREINGIEVSIDKPELASREEAVISFTYDPSVAQLDGRYRVDFTVLPISQTFEVYLDF